MCGIIGIYIRNDKANVVKTLWEIFKNQEHRGTDGGGISLLRHGKLIRYRVVNAYDLFGPDFWDFWLTVRNGDSVIFHHRFPTHGTRTSSGSHPFANDKGNIHLIHNGMISNYRDIIAKYPDYQWESGKNIEYTYTPTKKEKKKGKKEYKYSQYEVVDSEVMVKLLETGPEDIDKIYNEITGNLAILFQYSGDNGFYLYRDGNPAEYYEIDGNFYISSEYPSGLDKSVTIAKDTSEFTLYKIDNLGLTTIKVLPPKVKTYTYRYGAFGPYDDIYGDGINYDKSYWDQYFAGTPKPITDTYNGSKNDKVIDCTIDDNGNIKSKKVIYLGDGDKNAPATSKTYDTDDIDELDGEEMYYLTKEKMKEIFLKECTKADDNGDGDFLDDLVSEKYADQKKINKAILDELDD